MLTAMLSPAPERGPKVYSARTLAAFCLWAATCSALSFSFADAQGEGLAVVLGAFFCGLGLVAALVFVPLIFGLLLRPPPLAKPDAPLGGKAGSLVVESADDPMREALGWLPKLRLHETAALSGLLSFVLLAAWGAVDRSAPDASAVKRLLLAVGALVPPLLLAREVLARRSPP